MATKGILLDGESFLAWEDPKDPTEVSDWMLTWGDGTTGRWLGADTISTSVWALEAGSGLTEDSKLNTTTTTTIWLSGGNPGNWEITNTITTAAGRTKDITIILVIKET